MQYESGLNPGRWGGAGDNYYGLIQFGPNERKQFGIDTANPSFENQVDAAFKFFKARGYKPEMGFGDMYSTILAGSPGHLNRSDGAGTVADHLASKRMEESRALAAKFLGGDYTPTTPSNSASGVTPAVPGGLLGLRAAVTASDKPTETDVAQLNKLFQSISGTSGVSASPKKISLQEESMGQAAPMVRHLPFDGHMPKPKKMAGLLG